MVDVPAEAVVYVYICTGDAQPEEHEVQEFLSPQDRGRRIVYLRYVNGTDPEATALVRLHSIGPQHRAFVTAGVDDASSAYFDAVLPPSRAHWIQKARENLETGALLRMRMRRRRVDKRIIAQHAKQLSLSAGRIIRLSERGQSGLNELIIALNEELMQLVLTALE